MDEAFSIHEHQSSDGYVWKYRKYAAYYDRPAGHRPESRGVLAFVHGIQSHAGWYGYSCMMFAQAGFDVYFLDRRGSGMNRESRGDAPGFRRLLDDIAEFLTALPRNVTRIKLPVFLAGISWGGKLAVALERRHPGLIDGLILLCPGFYAKVRPTFWQRLGIVFSRLFSPRKLYPVPLNEPELFTETSYWQDFLRADTARLLQATARLLVESVRLDGYLRFCPKYVHVPALMLLAQEDRIIRNDWTRDYFERFATQDKQIIEYPNAHHTLEFEPDPTQFINDIQIWVESHLPSPPS